MHPVGGILHVTDVAQRLAGVRGRMADAGVGAFIARGTANVRYLTGFVGVWDDEPSAIVVVTATDSWVVTDSRFEEAAAIAAVGGPHRVMAPAAEQWASALADLHGAGVAVLGVEDSVPHRLYERVAQDFVGEIVAADKWVERLRAAKGADELSRIEAAQQLTDAAFDHILSVLRAGVTEAEIALELEVFMRRNGSEGVAFAPIVASGPNSALPHAVVTRRVLQDGDFVVLDFGARVGGYCADMTRTVVVGKATPRHREIYDAVLAANVAGTTAVHGGVRGREVDATARAVLEAAGLGEYFGHGLGHGVGLEVHEAPGVGPRSEAELPANAVVTIEPGVYVPGFGGARIEDLVVVEEAGARVLTRSAKDLIEL